MLINREQWVMKPPVAAIFLVIGLAVSLATAQDMPMPSAYGGPRYPSIDVGIINKKLPNGDSIQVVGFVEARPDGLVYFQRCNRMTSDYKARQVAILVSRPKGRPVLSVDELSSVDECPWIKPPPSTPARIHGG
jgi:hypothetical protein